MKTKICVIGITVLLLSALLVKSNEKGLVKIDEVRNSSKVIQQPDTLLNHIEQKIATAFSKGNMSKTDTDIQLLKESLLALNKKKENSIVAYWYSYTCYYQSILSMILKDLDKSEKVLDEGIDLLDEVENKTSEHYALFALMKSLSIRFAAGIRAPFISASVKSNAEKAVEMDSLNLRAYFVLGSNDFYTPEQFGGGKVAESYFKKAIRLKDQSVKNPYLPSWGKSSAYELLIRFYIKRERFAEAKNLFQEAIKLYPNDYQINMLASKLVNR